MLGILIFIMLMLTASLAFNFYLLWDKARDRYSVGVYKGKYEQLWDIYKDDIT